MAKISGNNIKKIARHARRMRDPGKSGVFGRKKKRLMRMDPEQAGTYFTARPKKLAKPKCPRYRAWKAGRIPPLPLPLQDGPGL